MKPKFGLVLGGGGSRGLAHIGVLEVLVHAKIPIDFIVGTRMGGIVVALFAYGLSPTEISEQIEQLGSSSLFVRRFFSAKARQNTVREYLAPAFEGKTFADLKIPLTVMAVDMASGKEIALNSGPLTPALLATSAVPAVFPPVEIDGMQLADGGVIDSLATHIAVEQGADYLIAVDVYPVLDSDNPWTSPISDIMGFELPVSIFNFNSTPSMLAATWRATRVMTWHLHQQRLAANKPDVLLRPSVDEYGSLDFRDVRSPILAGIVETERHLSAIRALVEEANRHAESQSQSQEMIRREGD